MDGHLGYGKHDPVGRNDGNSRNGTRFKTLVTEAGPVGRLRADTYRQEMTSRFTTWNEIVGLPLAS